MPATTVLIGILLILLGVGGWLGTGRVSITALIPAFFGLPLVMLGWVAKDAKEGARKHIMHAAVAIGMIGCIGAAIRSFPKIGSLMRGEAEFPVAIVMQLAMCLICAVFVALCVRSFIHARRQRDGAAEQAADSVT